MQFISYAVPYFFYFITESLKRVEEITGKKLEFHQVNLLDKEALSSLFKKVSFAITMEPISEPKR